MVVYHASREILKDVTLLPRVPNSAMNIEDKTVKRVCFSSSVNGCLTAIDGLEFNEKLYVYETIIKAYTPTHKQVPDAFLTGEVWSLDPVSKLKLVGVLFIKGYIGCEVGGMVNNQYSYEWESK